MTGTTGEPADSVHSRRVFGAFDRQSVLVRTDHGM